MSWIKQLVTFGLLWPPIAMFVGATLTEAHGDVGMAARLTYALIPLAYIFLGAPALVLGVLNKLIENAPMRFPVICALGFLGPAVIFATGTDASKFFHFGIAGLVPTMICALLVRVDWMPERPSWGV